MSSNLSFSTKAILAKSWAILKEKWVFLLGVSGLAFVISMVLAMLMAWTQESNSGLIWFLNLANQIASLWLSVGLMVVVLKVVKGEATDIKDLFTGGPYLVNYFVASLVTSLVVMFGLLLLVVPGIIWSIKYMFTMLVVIDKKLGFSEAMAESARLTQGIKWKLFGFGWVMLGINLLGCLPLFLGLFITVPVTSLAYYVLYLELQKSSLVAPVEKPTELVAKT
jgi:uncharacterized membrane protein